MRLTALDEAAERIGLKLGQGVAEARAMCPGIEIVEEDLGADRRLLEAIADWCDRYTPLIALDGQSGLFLDISGCAHLFGGERALLKDILSRLFRLGLDVRGSISSSPGLSWAIAHFAGDAIVGEEDAEEALAPLPVASLRLDEETVALLQKAGLKQVGDLIHMPRAPLARRFGPHLLLRLDQALCLEEEPVSPRRPVASLSAERRLAEPVQAQEAVLHLAGEIAETLKPGLEARGVGGRLFELILFRVDGKVFRIAAGASRPLREPKRIAALFCERLSAVQDDLDAGFGFEILRLNVLRHEVFDAFQADFAGDGQRDISLAAFVDQVAARLGPDCLQGFQLRESHVPERAVISMPAMDIFPPPKRPKAKDTVFNVSRSERPVRLFRTPELMEIFAAEVPDGPPARFRWRRMLHQVRRAEGPERIAAEWWLDGEAEATTRDYYRIEDETGRRFWIYREGFYGQKPTSPHWFMHGVFA